jgi:membrane protein DedA with SNARE-associated domain
MIEIIISHSPYLTYAGIILFLMLTGAGLPIPEEVPIVFAGYMSSGSEPFLNFYAAFAACLTGALLGDLLIYSIGRYLGTGFLRRHPHLSHLLHEEREKQMEAWIHRHGLKVFFVARFMVGIRAPIYLAAGMLRVPFRRFLLVDAFAATIVVGLVFWLSYTFGPTIGGLVRQSQLAVTGVGVVVAAVLLVGYLLYRRRRLAAECAQRPHDGRSPLAKGPSGADRFVA